MFHTRILGWALPSTFSKYDTAINTAFKKSRKTIIPIHYYRKAVHYIPRKGLSHRKLQDRSEYYPRLHTTRGKKVIL
jgi:hypothetical protein